MKIYYIFALKKNYSINFTRWIGESKNEAESSCNFSKRDFVWVLEKKISWRSLQKKELLVFTREFLFLLESGLTYIEILELMSRYEKNTILKKMVEDIAENIQKGNQLYSSFLKYFDFFGNFYLNILYIGEQSGNLEKSLALLVKEIEEKKKLRQQLAAILLYPSILLTFSFVVMGVLLYVILPTFLSLIEDTGMELPFFTRAILFFKDCFPWIVVFLLCLFGGIYWGVKKEHSEKLQGRIDLFLFRHFYQKGLYSRILAYQFSKYFEILLESGLTFQQILPILEKTLKNREFQKYFRRMFRLVYAGEKISKGISVLKIFSEREMYFFMLGEESGNLGKVFQKISLLLEEEIKKTCQKYLVFVEPCIFIVLGLCLSFIILGVYLPIFSLSTFV